ncbi:MAG: hypothetical protein Q7S12_00875 [bacterium]|nr:hypothetical protein [bacterium]
MNRNLTDKDIEGAMSSSLCRICGKKADGWRCPKCAIEVGHFDPFHWKGCEFRTKMEKKCKDCQRAESNCNCLAPK